MHLSCFVDVVTLKVPRPATCDRSIIKVIFVGISLVLREDLGSEKSRGRFERPRRRAELLPQLARRTGKFPYNVVFPIERYETCVLPVVTSGPGISFQKCLLCG